MAIIKCFDNNNIPELKSKFDSMVSIDMSESEQKALATELIIDYYKTLHDRNNQLRTRLKIPTVLNKLFGMSERVSTIKAEYKDRVGEITPEYIIEDVVHDEYSRVGGLSHQLTKELMEDMTSRILNNFFGEKATLSLANLADNKAIPIGEFYSNMKIPLINRLIRNAEDAKKDGDAESYTNWINLAGNINKNWADLVALNEQYLKTFGIAKVETGDNTPQENGVRATTDTSFDEDEQLNEESDQTFEADNKSQIEYDRDIFTISGKANASAAIRLLLSTLRDGYALRQDSNDPSVLPKLQFQRSSIGGYKFLPYARVFNQLANALVNTNKIENILNKLVKHGKQNAPIIDLIRKLKINTTTGKINYSSLSYDEWRILLDFTKTMSKQNPTAYIYVNQGGTSQFIPGDKRSGVDQIKNNFIRNVKKNNELFIYDGKSKTYKVNPEFFKKHPSITKDEDYIKFVNALGVKDVEGESISLASYKRLSPKEKSRFKSAVNQLYTQLKKQQPIFDTTSKSLQFATPINEIAGGIISMSKDDGVNTFLNILRKPVQTVVLNNPLSTFFNNFNSVNSIDELTQEEKGLIEGFSQGSIILEKGGRFFDKDGYRTDERIDVGYFDGAKNIKGARQSAKLSLINRRLNTFNLNLRGWFIPITNGDKKTEWMLSMGNNISYKEIASTAAWDRVYSIFLSYLETEMNVAQTDAGKNLAALKKQGRAGNLRFFLDILPEKLAAKARQSIKDLEDPQDFISLHSAEINKAVKIFMEREANKTKSEFTQYGIIKPLEGTELYSFDGIDDSFIYGNINDNGANRFNKEQINNTILYRTINQIINNIEIHKLFIGDPAFMTDPAKRIPGGMGGVNQSIYGSSEFNSHFSTLLNRVDVKNSSAALLPTDYGYTVLSEDVPITVYNDVEVDGRAEGTNYKNTVETDGASKMTLPAYRELKTRSAEWTDQQEAQYQYQMAFFRDRASKLFNYKYSSPQLEKHDKDLLSRPQPEEGIFEILKPKAWAQNDSSAYKDIIYLKTSTQPLIPTAIVNTNDEKLLKKMMDEGIKIAAFESAIKTGIRPPAPFYKDGKFNPTPYDKAGILRPTWKDLGVQVETQFSQGKTTLTFGSQLSTLSCLNLLSSGIPEGFTSEQWNKLTEGEKITQSPSYREVKRNDSILRELTINGYNTLLKKLAIEETAEGYVVQDYQKVINYLVEQSRDMDDNTRAALKIDQLTGQLTTPLEAIPTYTSLKAVLYSIVDKNIASPKMGGGGLVQMPSTGTENEDRTTLVGNSTYKFYTKEEPWIEVSLPAWFRDKLVEFYTKRNKPVPSNEELLSLINDKGILDGIGFRIPTQELNSAEVFKIKSFLPRVMGNAVIVPSEITKKAGSDFDIDKLSTYLKNIVINKNGEIDLLPSFETEQKATEYFSKEFDKKLAESKKALEKAKKAVYFKQSKAQDYAEGLLSDEQIDKYSDLLDDIFEDFNTPQEAGEYFMTLLESMGAREKRLNDNDLQQMFKDEYINRNVRKSLENAYYNSLQTLLQLPENFERLLAINTTKDLEDIKNTLNKALFTEKEIKDLNINIGEKPALSYLSVLSPNSLDEIRHNLITGKDGVGIAAAAQKSNSIMQRLPVTLDSSRMNLLADVDATRVEYMGDGVIRFPHNKVNGFPTISNKKTKEKKNYISDIISQYINGFVDIVKNTFIIEMGINTRTAGTFLFMDRLGNDTEHTTYFMNQPIIREYLKLLDRAGINGIRSKVIVADIQDKWGKDQYENSEQLPTAKQLLDNIVEYKEKNRDFSNLSPKFISEQAAIFREFLKYQEMAGDLFTLMQGINWDTAHMSDPEQFLLKDMKYWKANNTIFTPASEILSNVFIGGVRTNLLKARNALGSFIAIEHPKVRTTLDELKRKFISLSFMPSADDYGKIASRINNSFINYILQIKGKMSEKTLTNTLLDEATSAANLLEKIKQSTPKDSDLYSILKRFSVERRGTDDKSVKAITFRKGGNDKYDRDSDIDALRILKENAHTAALYGKLVRASLLQSGAQYTPISFSNLIPNEDYAAALSDPIKGLPFYTDLDNFLTSNAFVRNSWATNGVIPNATLSKKQVIDRREDGGNLWAAPFSLPKPLGNMPPGSIYTSIQYKGEYIKYQPINAEGPMKYVPGEHKLLPVKMALQNGDPTIFKTFLYEIVKDETGKPLTITSKSKNGDLDVYVYKAINAWGDGMYAQEYYDSPRASQISNNTFRVDENIVNDATILKALGRSGGNALPSQPMQTKLPFDKDDIYPQLGTKTKSENVVIDEVNGRKPAVENQNYYEGNIKPEPNTIFVFGSNPEGRHGAGAAKIAKEQFGAIYGQGEGLQGNAYALPTKDLRVKENNGFKSISFEQIVKNIQRLYEVARKNPNKQFKIGYRNTIDKSLNGYTGLEMIEMFNQAGEIPSNIVFSKEWIDTGKITQSFKPIVAYGTRGNNFLEAFEKDNAIGNPWSHLGSGQNPEIITEKNVKGKTEQELIEYLKQKYPEIKLDISNNPIWEESSDIVKNQEEYNKKVQYRLKAIEILSSDKAKEIFEKGIKNKWSLDKILTELQLPKEQKQLIIDNGKTNREEIITDLLANYSYTIEINTAKESMSDSKLQELSIKKEFQRDNFRYFSDNEGYWKFDNTIDDKDRKLEKIDLSDYVKAYRESIEKSPTQHYSNLTVPGGTNYTEQEIATPAIVPSIKGHAQFATDNGIGWMRSDDKLPFTGFLEDLLKSGVIKKVDC